jgi:hypothetical protein
MICAIVLGGLMAWAGPLAAQTTFTFGGYVKFDALYSNYNNGDVPETSRSTTPTLCRDPG